MDNYYSTYSLRRGQIVPFLEKVVTPAGSDTPEVEPIGKLYQGDTITVYPNISIVINVESSKVRERVLYYVESSVGNGYVYGKYIKDIYHTVTLNYTGGIASVVRFSATNGKKYGTLPRPHREGYRFTGWYTSVSGGKEITSSTIVDLAKDQTLYAHWTPLETPKYTVTCNPNGGHIIYQGYDLLDGNFSMQFTNGGVYKDLPDARKDGYAFEGWYTAQSGGQQITPSSTVNLTADQMLYARWRPVASCTVSFNTNSAAVAPPAQTVIEGGTVILPPLPTVDGDRCLGWYNGSTRWNNSMPVKQNMTLSARWDIDRFNFPNSHSAFGQGGTHAITGNYLKTLQNTSADQWQNVKDLMNSEWHGACYGMSALYCLRDIGAHTPGKFQSGAATLYDYAMPKNSQTVRNLVEYYYLQQRTPHGSTAFYVSDFEDGYYNKELVDLLTSGSAPVLICFFFNLRDYSAYGWKSDGSSGHAIVGLGCKKNSDGTYSISIWDPNQAKEDTLIVSSDYQTLRFTSGQYNSARIVCNQPANQSGETFNKYNIQDYLTSPAQAVSEDTTMNTFSTTLNSCTVTSADGRSATFQDGYLVSGTLNVQVSLVVSGGNSLPVQYILPENSSYSVSTPSNQTGNVDLHVGQYYIKVESGGFKNLEVASSGKVRLSSDRAAKQEISVTSDTLGKKWNNMMVKGTDTGFSLSAENEGLTIASDNNVSVDVYGKNVFTDMQSQHENVSATPSGVTVKSSALKNAQFTDVPADAYYYDAVLWASEHDITAGTTATTFSPNQACTRAQAVTFLWRTAGSPEPASNNNPFSDVPSDQYYYKAVMWAVENGITAGTSAVTFSPNDTCTRGQIVTFLYRSAGTPAIAELSPFADVPADAYYKAAVSWAAQNKITAGTTATTFSPNQSCTRAQIVTFLYRYAGE